MDVELLFHEALHQRVVLDTVLAARRYVWIATANLKDMHIALARGRYRPILETFDALAAEQKGFFDTAALSDLLHELEIRFRQVLSALEHPDFQIFPRTPQRLFGLLASGDVVAHPHHRSHPS
mgnify:CR=1 FL=1